MSRRCSDERWVSYLLYGRERRDVRALSGAPGATENHIDGRRAVLGVGRSNNFPRRPVEREAA